MGRIIVGTLFVLWGLSALLGFSLFKFFFALIVILIGVSILTGRRYWGHWDNAKATTPNIGTEEFLNEVAVFSPIFKVVNSENFKGGVVKMVFAGGVIDLSGVKTQAKEIELSIKTVFAGLKLIVPKGWKVNVQGSSIFGGYENRVPSAEGSITLTIKGSAVFGGIEIVN